MTQNTNFFISANQLFCSKSNILDHVSQSQDCVHHKNVLDSCCNNPSEVIFNRTHSAARPWTGRGFILNPHFHFSCKYIITLCTLVCKTHCCLCCRCVSRTSARSSSTGGSTTSTWSPAASTPTTAPAGSCLENKRLVRDD